MRLLGLQIWWLANEPIEKTYRFCKAEGRAAPHQAAVTSQLPLPEGMEKDEHSSVLYKLYG
jgi:hypothetical protein